MTSDRQALTCALFSSVSSPWPPCTVTYGRWNIHGRAVNTNLQRRWENTSLASSLPITLTDGAVMGLNWCVHISSNLISCLKREHESASSCGNNDIILHVHLVTQARECLQKRYLKMRVLHISSHLHSAPCARHPQKCSRNANKFGLWCAKVARLQHSAENSPSTSAFDQCIWTTLIYRGNKLFLYAPPALED